MSNKRKAVALISGGLDSLLAAKVVQEQGVHVEGINFFTGFCVEGHTHAIRKKQQAKPKRNNALWVAEKLNIKLHIIDIVEPYKEILLHPKYGYGANLNPCLDCKIFMVQKATEWMAKHGFDFLITGEVVGQRPMSQRSDTLPVIARDSGANDLLLRPLCAKNLPETKPEREGWVDRQELFDFSGRTRKPQMALARRFGIEEYAQPAGGCCFLTDEQYSRKLADLWSSSGTRDYDMDSIMLLKVGRHLRPRPHFKLIISREEGEGNYLQGYRQRFWSLHTTSHPGPLALIDGDMSEPDTHLAAQIVARYSQGRHAEQVTLELQSPSKVSQTLSVRPLQPDEILPEWMI